MTRKRMQVTTSLALVVILLMLLAMPVAAQNPIARFRNAVITRLTAVTTILTPQTAITIANDTVLTPLGNYQQITAAGAAATASITIQPAGYVLTLVNTANQTITFTDTGTLKLSGNAALGQYDVLRLMSDGTSWIQLSPEGDN